MILYLIRHGKTDWNKAWKLQGRTDTQLNDEGRHVAELTREALLDVPFDVVYTSPLSRAKETAEILMRDRNVPIIPDERIIELCFGIYEGTTPDETNINRKNFFDSPGEYVAPEGGEEILDMFAREKEFLDELIQNEAYKDSTILISTHGAALNGFMCVLKGAEPKDLWKNGLHKNCGMTIVEIQDGHVKILQEAIVLYDRQ